MKKRNKYKFGKLSERRLSNVSNYLQLAARSSLSASPVDFGVPYLGGLREEEDQYNLFMKGFSRADGYNKKSFHQIKDEKGKGQALDLVPYISGIGLTYEHVGRFVFIGSLMLEAWEELQEEGFDFLKILYLHWGGFWTPKNKGDFGWDLAHFEIRDYEQK